MRYPACFSVLLAFTAATPALAGLDGASATYQPEAPSHAKSVPCKLLEDDYQAYRNDAYQVLSTRQNPLKIVLYLEDPTWVDYATRSKSAPVHDIPQMFTRLGLPGFARLYGRMLDDLDQRQQRLCGYAVR